jgi:predicted TIM-barrel fold metal-dependent hydrolase
MIIDAHNHPNWHGHNAERILENMDEQGIDVAWLLSWEVSKNEASPSPNFPPGGSMISLADVLDVGRRAPDRFVLGYVPHPKRPDAVDRLKAAVAIHGIRLAGEYKVRVLFDDPDAIRLYRACAELGLPVTIHLDYPIDHGRGDYPRPNWWYGGSIEALERAMIASPETVFIGHGPGFWAHISGDDLYDKEHYPKGPVLAGGRVPELLDRYPTMYADLSAGSGFGAITRDEGFGRQFLVDFEDKLLFARDYFDSRLMDHLKGLELPAETFDKITYRNAQRLVAR